MQIDLHVIMYVRIRAQNCSCDYDQIQKIRSRLQRRLHLQHGSRGFIDQDFLLITSKQEASKTKASMDIRMHRIRVYAGERHAHARKQGATVLCTEPCNQGSIYVVYRVMH